ncbi:hypothetical protein L3X38_016958 [Prunus dulcis]|uniref:DUF4283 domain-containing protein n=1 Tax=Prunus dulcis TaxID=3755 RepID=A0AAD4Z8Q2_PRUDU|nr:hypothetical protein L3X38_016958 [Prunus dulcis]
MALLKTFTQLWKGFRDVSITEIGSNKYWVRFVCDRDKKRVLYMEPWAFQLSLILLAHIQNIGNLHSTPLSLGTFWVRLHGVLGFYMTVVVAKAIRAILGEVLWVDNREGSSVRLMSAPSPRYKSPIHSPWQADLWTNDGSGFVSSLCCSLQLSLPSSPLAIGGG